MTKNFALMNNRGVALLLVMWILVLLTVISGQFCHTMRTEVNITRNFKEETRAYYIARAGFNMAVAGLVSKDQRRNLNTDSQSDIIQWRINAPIDPIPFAGGHAHVWIENEKGKIHINRSTPKFLKSIINGYYPDENMRDVITASILDWRDKDQLSRVNGAENDYYNALPDPYNCGDSDFKSVEELLLVRGISRELFFNGLRDMVTVYPRPSHLLKKKKAPGEEDNKKDQETFDKINVNAASKTLLRSLPMMTDDLAQEIETYRLEKDIDKYSDLIQIVGSRIYTAILPFFTLNMSPYYTINAMGTLDGTRIKQGIRAVVKIDQRLENKYHILQWVDGLEYSM
jgi:general secretion pathway protein K